MILKDFFTDGLIQVAIALSLLRSDLNSYFDAAHVQSSIRAHRRLSHLQETHLGPLTGFTSTNLIIRDRGLYAPGFPKFIDSDYSRLSSSVLHELYSLSDFRRLDGIVTNIDTWLVSDAGSAARPVQGDRPPQDAHNGSITGAASLSSPEAEDAIGNNAVSDSEESELSKEVVDCC